MKNVFCKTICLSLCLVIFVFPIVFKAQLKDKKLKNKSTVTSLFSKVNAINKWKLVSSIKLDFPTFHTQGLTKTGDHFYLTSVKIIRPTQKYAAPQNGFDRDQGEGVGYLFKFDKNGKLIKSIILGEGAIYHPGGIDFDGTKIWVPVCEYRPFGNSIIYAVDPDTMESQSVTTIPDALGAVAYNRETNQLVGMNWGSRLFYKWQISSKNGKTNAVLQNKTGEVNPHFYVDFQDCNYSGDGKMLCSGLSNYNNHKGEFIRLGGLELIDMKNYAASLQLPVTEYTNKGVIITNNPFYVEIVDNRLRYYFIPEDNNSTLYVYESQ